MIVPSKRANPRLETDMNSNQIVTDAVDATEELQTDAAATDGEPQTAVRLLNFTLVSGYLRGDHACPFELHATGCRDLNQLTKLGLFSFNVYAESREAA